MAESKVTMTLTDDQWGQIIAALEVAANPLAREVNRCWQNAVQLRSQHTIDPCTGESVRRGLQVVDEGPESVRVKLSGGPRDGEYLVVDAQMISQPGAMLVLTGSSRKVRHVYIIQLNSELESLRRGCDPSEVILTAVYSPVDRIPYAPQ